MLTYEDGKPIKVGDSVLLEHGQTRGTVELLVVTEGEMIALGVEEPCVVVLSPPFGRLYLQFWSLQIAPLHSMRHRSQAQLLIHADAASRAVQLRCLVHPGPFVLDLIDLFRPALWIARALWWLGYEFAIRTVGWSIGWLIWRAFTLGRFPDTGIREIDETALWASILVEVTGLAALAGTIWWLHAHASMW